MLRYVQPKRVEKRFFPSCHHFTLLESNLNYGKWQLWQNKSFLPKPPRKFLFNIKREFRLKGCLQHRCHYSNLIKLEFNYPKTVQKNRTCCHMANTRKDLLECLIEFELAAAALLRCKQKPFSPFFHLKWPPGVPHSPKNVVCILECKRMLGKDLGHKNIFLFQWTILCTVLHYYPTSTP